VTPPGDELVDGLEEELFEHHRLIVDRNQSALRIDKFLMARLDNVSRNKIQNAIRANAIRVNDTSVKPNYKIKPGDVVTVVLPKPPEDSGRALPENIPLDIRYEDGDILIVHKPAGLVVHPGVGNFTGTLINGLAYHFQNQNLPIREGEPENRLGLAHRIDKDTSGLLVIAKTDFALNHLAKQFFDHSIHRRYVALVWGEPEFDSGTVSTKLGRNPRNRMSMMVYDEDMEGGKEAITHYRVLERMYYVSLIECELETGRTHQIRVHLAHLGHPIFGDSRYGGDKIVKGTVFSRYAKFVEHCLELAPRQNLHARSLGFVHPSTGESILFESELPEDMTAVLERWRKYFSERAKKH
jgi:23S rRNA pseudouridine1911/1915/1917 synthase